MPDNAIARQNLGSSLLNRGYYDDAVVEFRKALELQADLPLAMFNLGAALEASGRLVEAAETYRHLITVAPKHVGAYSRAAELMTRTGDVAGAIELLRKAHAVLPDDVRIVNDLAWRLATAADPSVRDGREAVRLAEYANAQMGGESCNELDTLATAYAEAGRFDDAVKTAERALAVARQRNQPDLATAISARLELFRQGQTYRVQ